MRILITGASGLIGTALTEALRGEHLIVCQGRESRESSPGVEWVRHDLIRDSWEQLSLPRIDVVYHLAAQTSIYNARQDPLADLSANVLGLLNLLEFLKKQQSPAFVVLAGTVTVAGLTGQLPINENSPDRPITFYDISKLTAEMYLRQYVREGWVEGCILRLANVYGRSQASQQADRGIIDKVFKRAVSGQDITVYGDGNYLRDYVFLDDVISAFVAAAKCRERTNGRTFCIGSGRGITLKDAFSRIASLAAAATGKQVNLHHVQPPAGLSDIEYRNAVVDSSAFEQATGWAAKYDFDAGIEAAYRDFLPKASGQGAFVG